MENTLSISIVSKMAEFLAPQVGNDILDIGSRKARRQRGAEPMAPASALMMGAPAQFDVPNVSNVRTVQCCLCWKTKRRHSCLLCFSNSVVSSFSLYRQSIQTHTFLFLQFRFAHLSIPIRHSLYLRSLLGTAAITLPRFVEPVTKARMSSS